MHQLSKEVKKGLSGLWKEETLNKIARESGFVKRTPRKLNPQAFIEMLFFSISDSKELSLQDYSMDLSLYQGKTISKQSLSERFNISSVNFLQLMLQHQLKEQIKQSDNDHLAKKFTGIIVEDTTKFALPWYMSNEYPGYGGATNSTAMMGIHFRYELIKGHIEKMTINPGRVPDQQMAKDNLGSEKTGYLYLRDMGFFNLQFFEQAPKGGYYYISRLKAKTHIYLKKDNTYQPLELKAIRDGLKTGRANYVDMEVYIGKERKVPVRILITLAPDQVVQERLRKVNKQNKSYGYRTSAEYSLYAQLNIHITNLGQEHRCHDVIKLYRLRWQIELIFKTWKSTYRINQFKRTKPERIKCEIYASLLLILLHWRLFRPLSTMNYQIHQKWLSILKFTKRLKLLINEQRQWLRNIEKQTYRLLSIIYEKGLKNIQLEQRKERINYSEIIYLYI